MDNSHVHLDSVLRLQRAPVCVESEPHGGRYYFGRERVSDMARAHLVDVSLHDYVVVPLGVAKHDALRTLDEETGLPVALRCLQPRLVHLFADLCAGRESRESVVEVQIADGNIELCGLSRIYCYNGPTLAQSFRTISFVSGTEVLR